MDNRTDAEKAFDKKLEQKAKDFVNHVRKNLEADLWEKIPFAIEECLIEDTRYNIHWQIENTLKRYLEGEKYTIERYVFEDIYSGPRIREKILEEHTQRLVELINQDLLRENKQLKDTLKYFKERL